ncbi:hypothetical protein RIEGSTA812A_PEG_467 [invertebrate metagenome]|uniref:Uncharacterized protein n=1 Tax=invertebrate metagenome TaxID=1711999 RepID=A0A484H652_9ZZZZ
MTACGRSRGHDYTRLRLPWHGYPRQTMIVHLIRKDVGPCKMSLGDL